MVLAIMTMMIRVIVKKICLGVMLLLVLVLTYHLEKECEKVEAKEVLYLKKKVIEARKSGIKIKERITGTLISEELLYRGPDDVLAKTVTKEYHGRMLTAGHGVTKKSYFIKRRDSARDAEVHRLTQLMLQMQKEMQQMRTMRSQLAVVSQELALDKDCRGIPNSLSIRVSSVGHSEAASCSIFDPDLIPEGESLCDMYVDLPSYHKVGSGSVFRIEGQRMHNELLKVDQVKVCFSEIVIGREGTPLPIPNVEGEIITVGHALGTFVAWPIRLISLQRKVLGSKDSKEKSVTQSVTPINRRKKPLYPRDDDIENHVCFLVCKAFVRNNTSSDAYNVEMSELFWGVAFNDSIGIVNLQEILKRDWLSTSTVYFYIRYLIDSYLVDEDGQESRFSFISPYKEAEHTHVVDILQKHEGHDHLVMIPYNVGNHWVLVAINIKNECIYYLDSLRVHHSHKDRAQLVQMINNTRSWIHLKNIAGFMYVCLSRVS